MLVSDADNSPMAESPDESDPLLDLKESLDDGDEPLFGGGAPAASPPQQPSPRPSAPAANRPAPAPAAPPAAAPPPLPPRSKTVSGAQPAHQPLKPTTNPGAPPST